MNKSVSSNSSCIVVISIDGMANYYLNDPHVRMPNLRNLANQGAVANGMESVFPTATWAIHTSIATGTYPRKHGVLGNWVIDRPTRQVGEHFGDRMWTKEEVVKRETFYDAAKRMGWTTASICWPVTRGALSIDHNIPEFYEQELFDAHCTPRLWEELKAAGLPVDCYGAWSKDHARGQMQDWLTTEAAKHLIRHHRPNLLMLHYLLPDSYQHDYGTRSKEVYWSLEYIDERIGDIIQTLKSEQLWGDTDLFVVSDHGFVDAIRTVYPNVMFKQRGWLDSENLKNSQVIAVSNGGSAHVYVLEDNSEKRELLRNEVRNLLNITDGVRQIFEREEFASLGLPAEGELEHHRPDFVFEAEKDCFVHFDHHGDNVMVQHTKFKGMHGYLPGHEELKAMFVAAGKSIRTGVILPEIKLVDVAPTIMRLLGTELPDVDGHALDQIWKEEMNIGNLDFDRLKTK